MSKTQKGGKTPPPTPPTGRGRSVKGDQKPIVIKAGSSSSKSKE
jgi:hypothetical protein